MTGRGTDRPRPAGTPAPTTLPGTWSPLTHPGSGSGTYSYAGTGQTELASQIVPGGATVSYGYGRANCQGLPIVESVTKTAGGTTLNGYVDNDASGSPQVFTTDQGLENFYVLDGAVGSPIALIAADGTQTGAHSYDPYGTSGTTAATSSAARWSPARFAGRPLRPHHRRPALRPTLVRPGPGRLDPARHGQRTAGSHQRQPLRLRRRRPGQ